MTESQGKTQATDPAGASAGGGGEFSAPPGSEGSTPLGDGSASEAVANVPASLAGRGWKGWFWPAVQAGVTVLLLTWIFSDDTLRENIRSAVGQASPGWLLAGVLVGGVSIAASVLRWQICLRVQSIRIPLRRTGALYLIGLFFAMFLPGAAGSGAVRMLYLFREQPNRKTGALLSIITDHLSGLMALILVSLLFTFSRVAWFEGSPVTEATLYFLAGFLAFTLLGLGFTFLATETGFIDSTPRWLPARTWMIDFARALSLFLRRWRSSLLATGVSFFVMIPYFMTFYCAARAFGAAVPLLDMITLMPIVDVASGLPISLSGVGVREKLFEQLLTTLLAVPAELAILTGMGGFACMAAWGLLGGLVFAVYGGPKKAAGR